MDIVRWRGWAPQTAVCILILALLSISHAWGSAAQVVAPPTDFAGISTTIIAIGTLLSAVLGAVAVVISALSSARVKNAEAQAIIATAAANAAEKTAKATEIKVDGSLTKFLDMIKESTLVQGALIREGATSAATLAEKTAQKDREQVAAAAAALTAAAVAASRGTRASDPGVPPVDPNVLALAEEKSKKLIEAAEVEAKQLRENAEIKARHLIEEAHRVSVTNTEPIPMKIVQGEGDDPIRTSVVQDVVDALKAADGDKAK